MWKIDKYAEKMEMSQSGKKSTIYSPPFLTSRHGYKMALSACLNGDGKGRYIDLNFFIILATAIQQKRSLIYLNRFNSVQVVKIKIHQ